VLILGLERLLGLRKWVVQLGGELVFVTRAESCFEVVLRGRLGHQFKRAVRGLFLLKHNATSMLIVYSNWRVCTYLLAKAMLSFAASRLCRYVVGSFSLFLFATYWWYLFWGHRHIHRTVCSNSATAVNATLFNFRVKCLPTLDLVRCKGEIWDSFIMLFALERCPAGVPDKGRWLLNMVVIDDMLLLRVHYYFIACELLWLIKLHFGA